MMSWMDIRTNMVKALSCVGFVGGLASKAQVQECSVSQSSFKGVDG